MAEPYKDASRSIDERTDDLLSRMNLAEKVGQLNQVPPRFFTDEQLGSFVRDGRSGTLINANGAYAGNEADPGMAYQRANELQRIAVEESRLGVPLLFARDVIHGHRTGLPINIALAAAFDMEMVEAGSAMAAREAAAEGIRWAFAPMVDVSRDGRWGRIVESAGEDPYLNGRVAEAFRELDTPAGMTFARETEDIPAAVAEADVAVLVVGESPSRVGENNSIADVHLPAGQEQLVRQVAAMGKPLVLVLCAARPVVLTEVLPFCDACLYAFHGGTMAGAALTDVITGQVNPSAKLPFTLPRHTGQIPSHYNRKSIGRPENGARYKDLPRQPLLPFGFGLSYTEFEITDLRLSAETIAADDRLEATARVSNVGHRTGAQIVQCYIQDCVSTRTRPQRELKGFERVELGPGESRDVSFTLSPDELGYYGPDGKWVVERGRFRVWVGDSSVCDLEATFEVL